MRGLAMRWNYYVWPWIQLIGIFAFVAIVVTLGWGTADYFGITGTANQVHLKTVVIPSVAAFFLNSPRYLWVFFSWFATNQFLGLMSVMAAGFSAWAAVASAKIGKKTLEKDRAWLIVHDFTADLESSETEVRFRARATNYGNTPATDVQLALRLSFSRSDHPILSYKEMRKEMAKQPSERQVRKKTSWVGRTSTMVMVPKDFRVVELTVPKEALEEALPFFEQGSLSLSVSHGVVTSIDDPEPWDMPGHHMRFPLALGEINGKPSIVIGSMTPKSERFV